MKTSREEILLSALDLFSVRGYSAVSMRDLAASVQIKSASLYNHFASKEEILTAVLAQAKARYLDKRKRIDAPDNADSEVARLYNEMSKEKFLRICEELFLFYVNDPFMSKLRKFLCIEQFANPEMGRLYRKYFFDDIIESQAQAFDSFMRAGKFRQAPPKTVALHFYAPIFVCFTLYDQGLPLQDALSEVKEHALAFSKNYNLYYDERAGF